MEAERFSTIPAFVNLSAGLSGDGGQAAGSHPSRDWQYHTDGAQALAQRWAAADPAEALNWFVKTTPYLTGGRKVQPSQCQQLRVKRASDLLTPLYREQPQAAVNWLRDQPWEWERSDVIPLTVVRAVATRQAASDLLPLMAEERYRFGFVLERARILEQERSGRARKPDSEPWTVEDIRSILPAANLTPEHQKQVDAMLARAAR
jgi:hypothetical protein